MVYIIFQYLNMVWNSNKYSKNNQIKILFNKR